MPLGRLKLWSTLLAVSVCALPALAETATELPCDAPLVIVDTADREFHARICETVSSVLPMLEQCHLTLGQPVTISFSDTLGNPDRLCFGLFHQDVKRMEILEPDAFAQAHEKAGIWKALPIPEHFDAIVVHEFVHALVDQAAPTARKSRVDEEYIAYAFQLQSLSEATRSALLEETGASAPISMEEINSFLLGFSPPIFATKAWLHFSEPENGCAFVAKLLQGETTFWVYPE